MKKKFFCSFILLFIFGHLWATHNRSGDITYKHLYGNTYEFTITTCTKLSAEADRPKLGIDYGDGLTDTLQRISAIPDASTDTKINTYKGTHTYTGAGTFIVQMQDPNRNEGVLNITNSVDQVFCIQTELVISPFLGSGNNSVIMEECPCPEYACLNQPWMYNLSAYDPDGDSLSYALIPCKGKDCINMAIPAVYQFPQNVGGGNMSMDTQTGTLIWDSPTLAGEYNLAIIVYEYRAGIEIGFVIRDMQLNVHPCSNQPPKIDSVGNRCVQVGQNIHSTITAADPDAADILNFDYYGQPYHFTNSPATFVATNSVSPLSGIFDWTPPCEAARTSPFPMIFEVNDNQGEELLKDIMVWNITVNAPPVQNVQVTPIANSLQVTWSPYLCSQVKQYNIYRSIDSSSLAIDSCCFNNQALSLGYTLLASVKNPVDTFFKDNNVSIGNHYCYLVTAVLENHTESCLSQQVCGELSFTVPILTRVSIVTTATNTGTDTVLWQNPSDLDMVQYAGPYQYKLYSALGNGTPNTLVFTSSTQSILGNCDTIFVHNNLNTNDSSYNYRVELWNNAALVGSSLPSESVFLSLTPNDNQMGLVWNINTTWQVDSSEIFRETFPGSGIFNSLARTTSRNYIDTGLINGKEYCYKIKTFGHYSLPQIQQPLINWSQIACAAPTDKTPPCAPSLQLQQDCKVGVNTLLWNNPNNSCADDVTHYALYYAAQEDGQFEKIEDLSSANDTVFKHSTTYGLVGCYFVTAFDSIQYNNESAPSNIICVDNCPPEYTLPNVVTLNGDGTNDYFHPLLPYRYVDSIDCIFFNRWGETIFETQNPMINWDGRENKKGKTVSEGVYYYLCKVYYLSLKGRKSIDLQGFFHVIRPK